MASEPAPAAAAAAVPAVVATAAAVAPIAPVAPVVTGGAGASTSSAARASAGPSTAPSGSALASAGLTASQIAAMTGAKMEVPSRRSFVHEGREIYEWEQTLDDVNVYIKPPPGVKASMLDCKITSTHVSLGLKGNPPFINEDLSKKCVGKESLWMMDGGELTITLVKAHKGETWPSVFVGHDALDPVSVAETQKRMLLERFGEEHPGFDFSQAEVNGAVPDPRTFMGGVKY